MNILTIKRESQWKFVTFGGGGASFAISVSGGTFVLSDPAGAQKSFWYGGVGGGPTWGAKLPKIGKVQLRPVAGAPTAFPSTGIVYATSNCPGEDLVHGDFQGVCAFVEAGGGLVAGGSGLVMLAGLQGSTSYWDRVLAALSPALQVYQLISSARAVIPMAGVSVGIQAGGGISGYVGLVW